MTPSWQRGTLAGMCGLLFLLPAGCGWYDVFFSPPVPDYRQPSDADIERMTQRMMGKAPAARRPTTRDGVEVVFQTGHASGIRALAASPNGRYLASSGAQDGTVKVWDVASGQEIRNFTGFGGVGQGADLIAFSQDSARIVTHEYGGAIKVFEVATGREVRAVGSLAGGGGAISADGRVAAVAEQKATKSNPLGFSGHQAVSVLDLDTGHSLWTLPDLHMQRPVAFSRDGKILLTVQTDVGLQTASTLETVGTAIGSIIGLGELFTPAPPATPTLKQELVVWDVTARKRLRTFPYTAMAEGIDGTVSPDGGYFVTEHPVDRALRILDLEIGTATSAMWLKASGMKGLSMTHSLVFSPDGKFLAVAKGDGLAKVFEFPGGREVSSFDATSLNFSPDGAALIVGPITGGAPYLHDVATGQETRLAGGVSGVSDLALTPDGRSVIAGMDGGSAKLWDLATGQVTRTFECPDGMAVSSVAVSRIGPLVATGCVNGSAWLWELSTGKQMRRLLPALPPNQFGQVLIRISQDGRTMLMALKDQLVVADLPSGEERTRITLPHDAPSRTVAMLENSGAAYEGLDPKVRAMMEAQTRSQQVQIDPGTLEMMKEAEHWIRSLAIHPKGELVAIAKSGGTSLWDLRSGKRVLQFRDMSRSEAMAAQRRKQEQEYERALEEAGSLKSLLPFGLGAPSRPSASPQVMVMDDPADLLEAMSDGTDSANSLAFSPDGRFLLTDGVRGKTIWDTATGKKLRTPQRGSQSQAFDPMRFLDDMEFNVDGMGVAFSPDGRLAARGHGQGITVWEVATGQERFQLVGHTAAVKSLAFTPDGRVLLSGGTDGALRAWDLRTGKEQAALIALGREDFVTVTPDQYYRASKTRIKGVAFRVRGQLYPFEQFDLRFNRPDIVLARLGLASPDIVQSYRLAYERRLKKMGLTEEMLGTDFHLPEIQLLTQEVPVSVDTDSLTLRVKAMDDKYVLARLNVFLNDVPVYGTAGLPIPANRQVYEQEIRVPLTPGRNKIQVSVLNQQGVESLKQTLYTTSTVKAPSPEIYVVGIGVSEYKDKAYNLRYAAKDAADLIAAYQAVDRRTGTQTKVHTLDLSNQKATKAEIVRAKEWLKQSKVNDLVVVFAAGHGMTDDKSDYYFGTYDIDPQHPSAGGLPYAEFENLLDGIPALQKLLLLDTCFSGEIDKDQSVVVAKVDTPGAGTVKMRSFKAARGVSVVANQQSSSGGPAAAARLSNEMLRFQQDWFADLRRGTGAAVISSSSGNEYSLEGEQWKNGVFTYALLTGLRQHAADANKDHRVTVSELQAYVIEQVRKLTQGGQNPTVRRENLEHDFVVY